MTALESINLALRALMEAGIVLGLGYWGWHEGRSTFTRVLLALAVPTAGFGFWGAVDFRGAGRAAEGLRLAQELAVSGLAAVALYVAGARALGWALGAVSVVHHALVYLTGGRLLKD